MNKLIKITILVLIILSITFFGLFYFDSWPFSKKTNEKEQENSIQVIPEITPKLTSPCLILDDKYCSQGELVYDGEQLVGLGFKLPEGSKVYAPFNGLYEGNQETLVEINGKHYPTLNLKIVTNEEGAQKNILTYFFAIGYHQLAIEIGIPTAIEKDQLFVSSSSLTVNNPLGDYNLILTFRSVDTQSGEWTNNLALLKEFFNYID